MLRSRSLRLLVPALVVLVAGCSRKLTKVIPDIAERPDTSFSEPARPMVDTSDEASFDQAKLAAELEREVREKLKPVYFEFNSFTLTQESMDQLVVAATFLQHHSSLRTLIEGHCDERGSSEYNMGLGENRARSVRDYLTNYGVPRIQLETTSYGKERPDMSNCREESCHARNRRGEFRVLEK